MLGPAFEDSETPALQTLVNNFESLTLNSCTNSEVSEDEEIPDLLPRNNETIASVNGPPLHRPVCRRLHNILSVALGYTLLHPSARAPTRGTSSSAGIDLYSPEAALILPWSSVTINTQVALNFPSQYYIKIEGRSGLAFKHNIVAFSGVIDQDYTGPIKVLLHNLSGEPYSITEGDRVAQAVLHKTDILPLCEVTLEQHNRRPRRGGLGSTGY